jgi:hypothetical protein
MPELNSQQHSYAVLKPHKWVHLKYETLNTVTRLFQLHYVLVNLEYYRTRTEWVTVSNMKFMLMNAKYMWINLGWYRTRTEWVTVYNMKFMLLNAKYMWIKLNYIYIHIYIWTHKPNSQEQSLIYRSNRYASSYYDAVQHGLHKLIMKCILNGTRNKRASWKILSVNKCTAAKSRVSWRLLYHMQSIIAELNCAAN